MLKICRKKERVKIIAICTRGVYFTYVKICPFSVGVTLLFIERCVFFVFISHKTQDKVETNQILYMKKKKKL